MTVCMGNPTCKAHNLMALTLHKRGLTNEVTSASEINLGGLRYIDIQIIIESPLGDLSFQTILLAVIL